MFARTRRLLAAVPFLLLGCATKPDARPLPPAVVPASATADPLVRGAPPDDADHLAGAAAAVDRGDEAAAAAHLRQHLDARPDAVMIRAYLAELLVHTGDATGAEREFERFVREAGGRNGAAGDHLPHAHTRLMELAEASGDKFGEQFHRGVGLVLVVRKWSREPAADDGGLTESTLAKAGRALREAERLRPGDPRPAVYLAEVYGRLGQAGAARAAAKRAEGRLPDAAVSEDEREQIRRSE